MYSFRSRHPACCTRKAARPQAKSTRVSSAHSSHSAHTRTPPPTFFRLRRPLLRTNTLDRLGARDNWRELVARLRVVRVVHLELRVQVAARASRSSSTRRPARRQRVALHARSVHRQHPCVVGRLEQSRVGVLSKFTCMNLAFRRPSPPPHPQQHGRSEPLLQQHATKSTLHHHDTITIFLLDGYVTTALMRCWRVVKVDVFALGALITAVTIVVAVAAVA